MTSRERFRKALNHQATDRVPVDMGATWVTGIAASAYARLRPALGLEPQPTKVNEPLQLLGMVEDDVRLKLGIDVAGIWPTTTIFGYRNTGWKPWRLQDGTDVLVSEEFQTSEEANGDILIYPKGDRTASPSGRLPKGGFYFDAIVRQGPLDEDHLDPNDWADQFGVFSDADLKHYEQQTNHLYHNTEFGIISNFGQGGLGDVAVVPGEMLLNPKGIRDPNRWYEFLALHPDYIDGIFQLQTEAALKNLKLLHQAVGNKLDAVIISGTDFGTQRGLIISPAMFRKLWKPYFTRMNKWVHENTTWKVFYHSCGSVITLLDDFVEMGVDILNPVQCSAVGMEPATLKAKYGDKLVFWGGGVDTQRTLPFGTPDEVYREVRQRIDIFGQNGGFVFNTIHNIQAPTPVENLLAMFRAIKESGK
ncbi:MAG: uroporphyrinogen decarboxylase family protein [Verrucomicrobiota bacterium]